MLSIVLILIIAISLFTSVTIIHTGKVGIVERLGEYVETLQSRFHLTIDLEKVMPNNSDRLLHKTHD